MTHNTARIRKLVTDTFDDPSLDAFCLDHYPQVYGQFSRGMRKDEKITLLLDYCGRQPNGYEDLQAVLQMPPTSPLPPPEKRQAGCIGYIGSRKIQIVTALIGIIVIATLISIPVVGELMAVAMRTPLSAPVSTIDSLHDGNQVDVHETVRGRYSGMPKGWRLWGVTQLEDRRYYLFQVKALPAGDGEWSLDVLFGDRTYGIGTDYRFFVIAVQTDSKEDLELAARPHGSAEPLPQGGLCRAEPITVRRVGPAGCWYVDYWDMNSGELRFSEDIAGRFLFKNWGEGSPAAELPKDNWSARFVCRVQFLQAGAYRFYAERDDGVRVWLDSQLVINAWEGGALVRETETITLTQGYHEIAVDFFWF